MPPVTRADSGLSNSGDTLEPPLQLPNETIIAPPLAKLELGLLTELAPATIAPPERPPELEQSGWWLAYRENNQIEIAGKFVSRDMAEAKKIELGRGGKLIQAINEHKARDAANAITHEITQPRSAKPPDLEQRQLKAVIRLSERRPVLQNMLNGEFVSEADKLAEIEHFKKLAASKGESEVNKVSYRDIVNWVGNKLSK